MIAMHMAIALQGATDDGVTLMELLKNIPHDAPAFVVYALVGASLWLVIRSGRSKSTSRPEGDL